MKTNSQALCLRDILDGNRLDFELVIGASI